MIKGKDAKLEYLITFRQMASILVILRKDEASAPADHLKAAAEFPGDHGER